MRIEDGKVYLEDIKNVKLYGELIVIEDKSKVPIVLKIDQLNEIINSITLK